VLEKKYTLEPLITRKWYMAPFQAWSIPWGIRIRFFLNPTENDLSTQDMKGSFGGIGAEIDSGTDS